MLTKIFRDGSRSVKFDIDTLSLDGSSYIKLLIVHTAEELSELIGDMIIRDIDPSLVNYLPVDSIEHLTDLSFKYTYYATDKAIEVLYGSEEGAGRRRVTEVFLQERELGKISGLNVDSIIMDDFL